MDKTGGHFPRRHLRAGQHFRGGEQQLAAIDPQGLNVWLNQSKECELPEVH